MGEFLPPDSTRSRPYDFLSRQRIVDLFSSADLVLACLALQQLDRSSATPTFLQGHMVDAIGTAANVYLESFCIGSGKNLFFTNSNSRIAQTIENNRFLIPAAGALLGQTVWELMQKVGWMPGTYDPGDFVAYGVGVVGVLALDKGIRFLNSHLHRSFV